MSRLSRARRDYSRKSFSNPLFGGKQGGGVLPGWRKRLLAFLAAAAVFGWVWFIAFSPNMRVTDIQVRGTDRIPDWEIEDAVKERLAGRRWLLLPKASILVVSEEELVAALNDRFVLERVSVTKQPPHTLVIDLQERVSAILLQLPDGSQGLIDLQGMVTKQYASEEALETVPKQGPTLDERAGRTRAQYPTLFDDKDESVELRELAVRPETVQAVIELPKLFDAQFNRSPYLAETHIDGKRSETLRAVTSEGWAIYLNVAQSLSEQLENAETILKSKVGKDRGDLEYIDVRFGEKVFFKLKS